MVTKQRGGAALGLMSWKLLAHSGSSRIRSGRHTPASLENLGLAADQSLAAISPEERNDELFSE